MGPVAFESLGAGNNAVQARRLAVLLKAAGIRVDLVGSDSDGFQLMVRSHDRVAATEILNRSDIHQPSPDTQQQ